MKKGFLKLLLFVGLLFIGLGRVYADDTFTFSIGGAKDVKPGDEFTVEVSVKGPSEVNTLTGYNLSVADTDKLTILEGKELVADNVAIDEDKVLGTVKFKVNDGAAAGDVTIKLEGTASSNGEEIKKPAFNAGTVSIRAIGSDTSLKSLKIPNTVLSPEFNKNVYDYTATVTDVTSVDIKAEPTDPHASIYITENYQNLVKGVNDITVVVKAENDTEKWYGIKVTLNVTPTDEELKAQDTTLQGLTVKGQKIEFTPTEKKYYINVDYDVTKINVTATPTIEGAEVAVSGDKKLVVGKNTVKITVTSADKSKTDTYQIIVTRADEEKEIVQTCPDETSKKEWIILTVSLLVTFTLGIVLGYFLGKKDVFAKIFKKKQKEETPVEVETLSDTIDLSDTVAKVNTPEEEKIEK